MKRFAKKSLSLLLMLCMLISMFAGMPIASTATTDDYGENGETEITQTSAEIGDGESPTNGTNYTFEVRAVNAIGGGTSSGTQTATPATTPGAPTGLSATPGNTQVVLNWTTPASNGGSAITSYQLSHGATIGYEQNWVTISGSGAGTVSHTVTGVTNETDYTFEVRAVNAIGNSASSGTQTAMPQAPAEPTPNAVVSYARITLTRNPSATNGLVPNAWYLIEEELYRTDALAEIPIQDDWFGTTISIIKVGTGGNRNSAPQSFAVPNRPGMPMPNPVGGVLTIGNVDDTMEYRLMPGGGWTSVPSGTTEVTVPAGVYEVRVRGNPPGGSLPSVSVPVIVTEPGSIPSGDIIGMATIPGTGPHNPGDIIITIELGNNPIFTSKPAPDNPSGDPGIYRFEFTNLPDGIYNLVSDNGDIKVTEMIEIRNGVVFPSGPIIIEMPEFKMQSVVDIAGSVPVAVSGLHDLFDNDDIYTDESKAQVESGSGMIEIALLVAEKDRVGVKGNDAVLIESAASGQSIGLWLDMEIWKSLFDDTDNLISQNRIPDIGVSNLIIIAFELTDELKDQSNLRIIRVHNGVAQILPSSGSGERAIIENGIVMLHVHRFSTYAETPVTPGLEDETVDKGKACWLCAWCCEPRGLCIFIWLLILIAIAVTLYIILRRHKKKERASEVK